MTPVRSKRGKFSHVTQTLRTTACGRRCDGWLCLDFEPEKNPEYIDCRVCREALEFN